MTATTVDGYEAAGHVLELALDVLYPSVDNPRTELDEIDRLAASIREVGVLEPIVVHPEVTGGYRIMFGHRRHAAAQLAGLMTIPCLVREPIEPRQLLISQVIENVQRHPLNALDEARAFERLVDDFDLTHDDIATRVGISQATVTKRLALLRLPAAAHEAIRNETVKLAEAYKLTQLVNHPERIVELVNTLATEDDVHERLYHIDDAIDTVELERQDAERDAAVAAKIEELTNAGKTVVAHDTARPPKKYRILGGNDWAHELDLDKRKHAKEPCHATVVTWTTDKVVTSAVCTDWDRHTKAGASELKATKTTSTSSGSKEQKQLDAQKREAAKLRKAFMTRALAKKPNRAEVTDLALRRYLADAAHDEQIKMCDLLGLEVMLGEDYGGQRRRDYNATIDDFTGRGETERLKACLAFAFVQGEWSSPWAFGDEHHALIEHLGYQPTAFELEQRKAATVNTVDPEDEEPAPGPGRGDDDIDISAHDAGVAANEAMDRVIEKAIELNRRDDPRIRELSDELYEGVGARRAAEIQNEFDVIFAELNELQPGDTVDVDTNGAHTIERAVDPETGEVHVPTSYPPKRSEIEIKCRAMVTSFPPDHVRVNEIRTLLLYGVDRVTATTLHRELKTLAIDAGIAV